MFPPEGLLQEMALFLVQVKAQIPWLVILAHSLIFYQYLAQGLHLLL